MVHHQRFALRIDYFAVAKPALECLRNWRFDLCAGGQCPFSTHLHLRRTERHIYDALGIQHFGWQAKLFQTSTEQRGYLRQPAPNNALGLGGLHARVDSFLNGVGQQLVVDLTGGSFCSFDACACSLGYTRLNRPIGLLLPRLDRVDQRVVLRSAKHVFQADVRTNLVKQHRQRLPLVDVLGNQERLVASGINEAPSV